MIVDDSRFYAMLQDGNPSLFEIFEMSPIFQDWAKERRSVGLNDRSLDEMIQR